ncbi:MAG: carbohydrate ABC transporter permease, partial [Candidatus Sumerlaeia bacterium]|nr:carbohydrate ABC transporter permease [Candidatus Sumerlaeia bacterium]
MRTSHWKSTIRDPRQLVVIAILMALLVIALVPFIVTILVSQKTNAEIYSNLWSLPTQLRLDYYTDAYNALFPYMWNSLIVCVITVGGVITLASLSGYVFARLHFAGKNLLFMLLLALMMVPGILTLVPAFKWIQGIPLAGGNDIIG